MACQVIIDYLLNNFYIKEALSQIIEKELLC